MKKNLVHPRMLLLLCTTVIFFIQQSNDTTHNESASQITEKLYPETAQEWPESPVPKPLGKGAKKRGGKGKR